MIKRIQVLVFILFSSITNIIAYEFKNEEIAVECDHLSKSGLLVLETLSLVEKELNISIIVTSGNRTWEEQLEIMLKRQENYRICENFRIKFNLTKVPSNMLKLTSEQLEWWRKSILDRANTYFPHVGGNAVDIRVYTFTTEIRKEIASLFKKYNGEIIFEAPPKYNVPIESATVFHLTMVL